MVRRKREHKGGVLQHEASLKKKRESIDVSDLPVLEESDDEDIDGTLPHSESAPSRSDQENYQKQLKKLYIKNKLSAKDIQETAEYSTKAGSRGSETIVNIGNHGANEHANRYLRRLCAKDSSMPKPYYASIPTFDPSTGNSQVMMLIPMLLLHEMLDWLISKGRILISEVCKLAEGSGLSKQHEEFCKKSKLDSNKNHCRRPAWGRSPLSKIPIAGGYELEFASDSVDGEGIYVLH